MLVLGLELVQLDFLLHLRRVDLAVLSTKDSERLQGYVATIMKSITSKGYSVRIEVTSSGVMT